MSKETKCIGVGTTIIVDNFPITFHTTLNSTTLAIEVASCKLDMVKTVDDRFNDFNVVLPDGSSNLSIAKFGGSISKTDANKTLNPEGEYRLINFEGELENITIPIPVLSDITIDKVYFYYQYLSAPSTSANSNFKDQIIFLGCHLSVKDNTDLSKALTGASLSAAYFLSNDATIIYFDFAGTIHFGEIVKAIFGVSITDITITVQSAGIFNISKSNKTTTIPGQNGAPSTSKPTVTYLDALNQIALLQGKSEHPTTDSDVSTLMPTTFPLAQKQVSVDGKMVTQTGIKVGNTIDTDFTTQFTQAFSGNNVSGICFWVMIDFSQISLFNSLITIGYANNDVNALVLYGFKTTNTDNPQNAVTAAYFYAQLPVITLFNFLSFGGLNGRQGILFKYTSNNNQYELNGSINFDAFGKTFVFGGDLIVNNTNLLANINLSVSSANQTIPSPLGMTGINFANLYLVINKTFAQAATSTQTAVQEKLDLAIGGYINLNLSDSNLQLTGKIVFENSEARLILVSLTSNPVLTLYSFVTAVVGQITWQWADEITKQFGLISGTMYYLSAPDSQKNNKNYTFTSADPFALNPSSTTPATNSSTLTSTFVPGYHLNANLLFFEKYIFIIDLSVIDNGVIISGAYDGTYENNVIKKSTTITAFFIEFQSPVLSISTVNKIHFKISVKSLSVFGLDLGTFTAEYYNGKLIGTYNNTNPNFGKNFPNDPNFGFEWQWTKGDKSGGFSITKINGIAESGHIQALASIVKKLNSLPGGGACETIAKNLFGENFVTKFSPSLQTGKSPSENGDGTMHTPIALNYNFTVSGHSIVSNTINIDLDVTIPNSFAGLPNALFDTITANLDNVISQLLEQPAVYEAIALEMAKIGAKKLATRMLCKAAKEVAEALAKALAKAIAEGLIAGAVGELLALQAAIIGVMAAGIAAAALGFLGVLKEAWDAIKKLFSDDSDKKNAQDKLNAIKGPILELMDQITANLKLLATTVQIHQFQVSIDAKGQYVAVWDFPNTESGDDIGSLKYDLIFLSGPIGDHSNTNANIPSTTFIKSTSPTYIRSWQSMLELDPNYQMNASIQSTVFGYEFLTPDARADLVNTISTLDSIGDSLDGAVDFNNSLKAFVQTMDNFNKDGLKSNAVYATLDGSYNQFKIGQGSIGINTKI